MSVLLLEVFNPVRSFVEGIHVLVPTGQRNFNQALLSMFVFNSVYLFIYLFIYLFHFLGTKLNFYGYYAFLTIPTPPSPIPYLCP